MTVHTIGSASRDYATAALWFAACPANLVTASDQWIGECYNDSEFTGTAAFCTFTGITTDAANYIELTCAPGQSFSANASVRTNGLRYNVSNGVGFRLTSGYEVPAFQFTSQNDVWLVGLQVQCPSTNQPTQNSGACGRQLLSQCILDGFRAGVGAVYFSGTASDGSQAVNCLIINRSPSGIGITVNAGNPLINFCTIISPSNILSSGHGISAGASGRAPVVKSTVICGFTSDIDFVGAGSATNYTSAGTPSTSFSSVTYSATTPFTEASAASSLDFRSIGATALVGDGTQDSTNGTVDISNALRPTSGATKPDVGVWEVTPYVPPASSPGALLLGFPG